MNLGLIYKNWLPGSGYFNTEIMEGGVDFIRGFDIEIRGLGGYSYGLGYL